MLYGAKDEPGEAYERLIFDANERLISGEVNTCGVYLIKYGKFQNECIYKVGMSQDLGQRLLQYAGKSELAGNAAYLFCESRSHALACEKILKSMMTDNPSSRKWKGREYFAVDKECPYNGYDLAERLFAAMARNRTFNDADFVAHCLIHHHPHASIYHTGRDLHKFSYWQGCKGENWTKNEWIEFGQRQMRINYHNEYDGHTVPESIHIGFYALIEYLLEKKIWYDVDGLIYHWCHVKGKDVDFEAPEYDTTRYAYMRQKKREGRSFLGGDMLNPEPIVSECCPYYLHYGLEIHRSCFMQQLDGGKHIRTFFNSLHEIGIYPEYKLT